METKAPALFLAGEAASVIAALRSNLKFNRYSVRLGRSWLSLDHRRRAGHLQPAPTTCSAACLQAQDDELEDPLLEDFKTLRRKLFAWQRERQWRVAAAPPVAAAVRCLFSPCAALSSISCFFACWVLPAGAGWEEVDPLEYLAPFLETVKSPETSGPITLVALAALHKIISRGILGARLTAP